VSSQTPALVGADLRLADELARVLRASAPWEGCALLLGRQIETLLLLQQVWPCCNVWPDVGERHRRFAIDPREQLLAQRWARRHQGVVLGFAHSHPQSTPVPSVTDRQLCVAPALMLIQGTEQPGAAPSLACWWIPDEGAEPQRLPWRMGG
jgi:proteasome lid subunit RPN8/RPN11